MLRLLLVCMKYAVKKVSSKLAVIQLKTGMYKKVSMPHYDFNELLKKWPYRDAHCVSDEFQNLPYDGKTHLSFIVPMYNSSAFIERLYHQLTNQKTRYNYEIIFVNDGSTDNTDDIMHKLCYRGGGVKYISQENKGIGEARNTGISNAVGEYISFVDHDDEITELFTEKILNAAYENKADIAEGWYGLKVGELVVKKEPSSGYVMGGVYKRKLFQRVRFPSNKYWYEDMINGFLLKSQTSAKVTIPDVIYFKNKHAGNAGEILWSSGSYQSLEQVYLTKSLIQDYRKLGLNDEAYLFSRALNECSSLMVSRTQKLDIYTRYQVFLSCCEIISSFNIKPSGLTSKQKFSYKAMLNKDFRAWELAARI